MRRVFAVLSITAVVVSVVVVSVLVRRAVIFNPRLQRLELGGLDELEKLSE